MTQVKIKCGFLMKVLINEEEKNPKLRGPVCKSDIN